MWNSTNPALANDDAFNQFYGKEMFKEQSNIATLQGVVNKTAILTAIAVAAGALGYWLFSNQPVTLLIGNLVGFVVVLGVFFVIHGKPHTAVFLAPVYAVFEGALLGGLTCWVERILAQKGVAVPGGVALQAFIITGSCLGAMLALYATGVIKPTRMLGNIVSTAVAAIGLTYLVSFILSYFGVNVPFISVFSAANETGGAAWIGLGINLVILGIASLTLIMDFGMIQQRLRNDSPKYVEWYCGFALLVTLAWIYYESLKLVLRVASLLNKR